MSERTPRGGDPGTRQWLSVLVTLVGVWILASPFVLESTDVVLWNNVVVGAVIALVGAFTYYRQENAGTTDLGPMILVAILGLWVLVSPVVMAVGADALVWSNVVAGLAAALLGGYVAYERRAIQTGPTAGAR